MRTSLWGLSSLATLSLGLLAACGTDVRDEDPDPAPRATWYQDVAPIVSEHCMSCHQDGGIAPFELTTYETAFEYATRMLDKVESGQMPPFDAREESDCTPRFSWKDDPRLSAEEIDTLKMWIEDGRPEGTEATVAPPPSIELPNVTQTLKPVVPFTASGDRDQFICYVLDPKLAQGSWLTGMQIRPGNDLVVHHVVLTELMPGAEHDAVVAQRGVGIPWDCSQTATPGSFVVNIWTPGNQPMQTSQDLAVPILAGAKLVMNIHYHPANQVHQPDATEVDIRTSNAWPRKMYFVGAFGNSFQTPDLQSDPDDRLANAPEFRIPAGAADHNEHMRITVPPLGDLKNVQLYSANPHMHMVGTHISATIERPAARGNDPKNECLANGGWNFDWQRTYVYDTTLDKLPTVQAGDILDLKCKWNNTMANPFVQRALKDAGLPAPVNINLGEGSLDEMCLEIFGLAVDAPAMPTARTMPTVNELPMELMSAMRIELSRLVK